MFYIFMPVRPLRWGTEYQHEFSFKTLRKGD